MTPEKLEAWACEIYDGFPPTDKHALFRLLTRLAAKMREPDAHHVFTEEDSWVTKDHCGSGLKLYAREDVVCRPILYLDSLEGE